MCWSGQGTTIVFDNTLTWVSNTLMLRVAWTVGLEIGDLISILLSRFELVFKGLNLKLWGTLASGGKWFDISFVSKLYCNGFVRFLICFSFVWFLV